MNQVFQDLYQLIWKEIFPDFPALPIEDFQNLYTKDLLIPQPKKCQLSGQDIYLSPYYRYQKLASKVALDAKESWQKPKQEINSLSDVLSSIQDVAYSSVGRVVNSEVVEQSDSIYSSSFIYNSAEIRSSQKMMFCYGHQASEYLLASSGNGDCSFGIRLFDSGSVSNSFEAHWCGKSSNIYFCKDCGDLQNCMFCFHISSKQFCIGNMQFEEEEYYRLKKIILTDYFNQLNQPNAFVSLSTF